MNKYLENQPKSHSNKELEDKSFDALSIILPKNRFIFRDERAKDNGIDGSIEVIFNGNIVNFRSQFQLKAKNSLNPNKDGSFSCSVLTSNLNHLLNNPISLYFLYIEETDEIRFVWAREEEKRLNKIKPNWQNQDEITLNFFHSLNDETINQIHTQIIKEGTFHRRINEANTEDNEANIKIEIDSLTLEVTDGIQAKKLLKSYGTELINSNYEIFILEKFNLLSEEDKQDIDILLLKSMAENNLGKYRTALDTLGRILLQEKELTKKQDFLFGYLKNSCDYETGNINSNEFFTNSRNLVKNQIVNEWKITKFDLLRIDWANERDFDIRRNKLKILETLLEEIITDEKISEETKMTIEINFLEANSWQIMFDLTGSLSCIPVFKETGTIIPEFISLAMDSYIAFNEWFTKANHLLQKTNNLMKQALIVEKSVSFLLSVRNTEKYWMNYVGVTIQTSNEFDVRIEQLKSVIEIYSKSKQDYLAAKAKLLLADVYYFVGNFDESERLKSQVKKLSKGMSYSNLVWTSENLTSQKISELSNKG